MVLIETDAVGGVWSFSMTLARGLRAAGHGVELAVVGPSFDPRRAAAVPPGVAGAPLDGASSSGSRGRCPAAAAATGAPAWLAELAVRRGADVVQACSYRHAAAGMLDDAGVPLVLTAHSDVVTWWRSVLDAEPPAEYDPYRRTVERALTGHPDDLVAPTAAYAQVSSSEAYPPRRVATRQM